MLRPPTASPPATRRLRPQDGRRSMQSHRRCTRAPPKPIPPERSRGPARYRGPTSTTTSVTADPPSHLDELVRLRTVDQRAAPGRQRRRADRAEDTPSSGPALIISPIAPHVAQPGQHRVEHRPRGAAGSTGHDDMQPEILGVRQEVEQRSQRITGGAGHQVVVVDDDVDLRPRPPGPVPQLVLGHVVARHPRLQPVQKRGQLRCQGGSRYRVSGQVVRTRRRRAACGESRRSPVVPSRRRWSARSPGTACAAPPSCHISVSPSTMRCGCSAKSTATGRNSCSPRPSRISRLLPGRRPRPRPRREPTCTGSSSTGGALRPSYRTRSVSALAAIASASAVLVALPSNRGSAIAISRPSRVMPRPGRRVAELSRPLPIHLGLRGIAQPQFDACPDLVLEGRPDLRPPRRRHDDMNSV